MHATDEPRPDALPELTFAPDAPAWRGLVERSWAVRRGDARAMAFRREMGLPTDRPVVLTGHQAELWHAGILAKHLAADALASEVGAAPAWLIVDQDERTFDTLRAPVVGPAGALAVETLTLASPPPGWATAKCHRFEPPALRTRALAATASVSAGLRRIETALREHSKEADAARQVAGALLDLAAPLLSAQPTVLYATELACTALFNELVDRMAADPASAVTAYNQAVRAHPDAGVRELAAPADRARIELPLWRLEAGEPRKRVTAGELPSISRERLAPTALFMTALARLAGCDLFIHGLGGGAYDPIAEDWARAWLGSELGPMSVATATLQLPLPGAGASESDVARAVWLAHRARHDPAALGDAQGAAEKSRLVESIRSMAPGPERAQAFRAMHARLADARERGAQRLAELAQNVNRARAVLAGRDIALDRTWAFPLHAPGALDALRRAVAERFRTASAQAVKN